MDLIERDDALIILPRKGTTAQEIAVFLTEKFQQSGQGDGNPLINAEITYDFTSLTEIDHAARKLHDAMAENGIGRACAYDDLTGKQKQDYRDYVSVVLNSLTGQ